MNRVSAPRDQDEAAIRRALGLRGAITPLSGGRTNRVWRCGDVVIKLYRNAGATPLFANDAAAEWLCLAHLNGSDLAPVPLEKGNIASGPFLVYRHVHGPPVTDPKARTELLQRLHKIAPPAGLPEVATGNKVLEMAATMLRPSDPLHQVRPEAPPPAQSVFLHRDATAANVIDGPNGPCLIDWQCPGIGDPVEDLAHAASPAMAHLYGGTPGEPQHLAWHWRMAAYCQWQIDRGNEAYAAPLAAECRLLA